MEMCKQAGRSLTLRQAEELAKKVAELNTKSPGILILNKDVKTPHYVEIIDNHFMSGSTNAVNYDFGLFVTSGGMLGKFTDGGGKAIALGVIPNAPNFKPKRILDMGCDLGHNTLPWATAFPDAEVIGIGAYRFCVMDTFGQWL